MFEYVSADLIPQVMVINIAHFAHYLFWVQILRTRHE